MTGQKHVLEDSRPILCCRPRTVPLNTLAMGRYGILVYSLARAQFDVQMWTEKANHLGSGNLHGRSQPTYRSRIYIYAPVYTGHFCGSSMISRILGMAFGGG